MPLLKPIANEDQDTFISRCMGDETMNKEYPDQKQRAGVCHTQWDRKEMKLDTVNIGGVEIFETGIWKGINYTEKDIDGFINNFNKGVAEPYVTIDHSNKASKQFKDALQALSLGFVSGLKRVGKKLIADFKQVPKTIADLIEAGALKKKSIEFFRRFNANGKEYLNVLQGVTFHGANGLPEVNTLSDFLSLYKSSLQTMDIKSEDIVSLNESDKEVNMSDIQLKRDEYNDLLKAKSQADVIVSENERLKKQYETFKSENDKITAEMDKMKTEIDAYNKAKTESLKKEATDYVNGKIKDGFIKPAHLDRYVNEYINYKKDDKLFADWKDDIDSRGKVIDLNPTKTPEGETTNFKYEPEKLDFKVGSTINYDELEDKIQAIMKTKKCTYEEACIECGIADKGEFEERGVK